MSRSTATTVPLVERADDALLFRNAKEDFTTKRLLRDVSSLAGDLPDAGYICNLCHDRYCFTVTLLASVLRGAINLLSSDRSPGALASLARRFDRVISVSEAVMRDSPLQQYVISLPDTPDHGAAPNVEVPIDRPAAIVFTSGSTGEPVGFHKSWGALAMRSRVAGARFGMTAARPAGVIGTVPPQHMYGFETTVLLPLHTQAASWCGPAFYPRDVADALQSMAAPRLLITTPLQIRSLLEAEIVWPPLDCVISATAPLPADVAAAAERRWRTRVLEIYGATEVGSIASRRTVEGPFWTTYDQISLVREPGTERVLVEAPHAEVHPLADLVELRSSTEFALLGRGSDIVKLGGRRASLAGLNAILTSLPGVQDGVFVIPDDLDRRTNARLIAFVVAPTSTPEVLLAELRRRIEPVFLPRRMICVESLPRNDAGKLPRAAVSALIDRSEPMGEPGR
jgi:acyl-coenzyme A synthetase/AMP-(fatty) acid ligase